MVLLVLRLGPTAPGRPGTDHTTHSPHVSTRKPIKLLQIGEHDSLGWHVDPNGERLGGEENLDEPLAEENFNDLLQQGEEAAVVDSDAALQEGEEGKHLGERLVGR